MLNRSSSLLALVALSGCEFFNSTVVPASDSSDPWAVVSLYFDGRHRRGRAAHASDFCGNDGYLVTREWFSRTEDFGGNVAYYGKGQVKYVQW